MTDASRLFIAAADALAALLARVETLEKSAKASAELHIEAAAERDRLRADNAEIARVLGVTYEADGHNVQAAPLPVILERIRQLTRIEVEWAEATEERDRLRAAIEGHCKAYCVHFRHLRVARFEGRHAPECLAYELSPDDDDMRQREPQTEGT
jgi:hypothetical protein